MKKNELKKLVEMLSNVVTFLDEIVDSIDEEETVDAVAEEVAEDTTAVKPETKKSLTALTQEKKVTKKAPDEEKEVTGKDITAMSYNELKAYAKELNVKAVGSRNQIITAIRNAIKSKEEVAEEKEEEVKTPSAKKAVQNKKVVKKPVEEEEEEVDDADDEEEDNDIKAQLEDMTLEELADILSEAGLSTKGKKEALITRVLKGIEDGVIEYADDDEDEEVAEDDEDDDSEEEVEEEDEEDEDDSEVDDEEDEEEEYDINDTSNPDMTSARKKAIIALRKEMDANLKKKKSSALKEMINYLTSDIGISKAEIKKCDDSEIKELYFNSVASFINDEGDEVDPETPYELNGLPACCGNVLEYNEETESYVCPICGAEYEAEEEE